MVHLGIDIGTSHTVVAVTSSRGEPEVLSIKAGDSLIPSVINVTETGGARTVGFEALDEWADPDFDQASTFRRWKVDMGEGRVIREMRFGGPASNPTTITPELLTTWLVEDVLKQVSQGIGGVEIESVLVTVPHGWRRDRPDKCRATRLAAGASVLNGKPVRVQPVTVSEPVAAAVYWLWEARRAGGEAASGFTGQPVLVVDIGAGTFDLSLVRVGDTPEDPLVVIDAANHYWAGDYVTALVLGEVLKAYNREHSVDVTVDPEQLLARIGSAEDLWLRGWFLQCQRIVHKLSHTIAVGAARAGRFPTRPVVEMFADPEGREVTLRMTPGEFLEALEPFHRHGRELIEHFLGGHDRTTPPYAVVFAGGGSRIAGVPDRIVAAALRTIAPNDADAILGRIAMNLKATDRAIALGAALVANGVVQVQERLLCDIGIVSEVEGRLAGLLGLKAEPTKIILAPILARGSELPATFRLADHGGLPPLRVEAGETLPVEVVVFDDPDDPWVQSWEIANPTGGQSALLQLDMAADTDGVLELAFRPIGRPGVTIRGRLARRRAGHASLVWKVDEPARERWPRVSIEELTNAQRKARRGGAR